LVNFAVYLLNILTMKKIFLLCMAVALTGIFGALNAQDKSELSNKAVSAQYKYEIDVLNSEIKTAKIKLKADQNNLELRKDLEEKQTQLKEVKVKKKIIDDAIKSKAASEKAAKKAEKASEKAEKAQLNAEKKAANAQQLKEKEN